MSPLAEAIAAATGQPFQPQGSAVTGGGCINQAQVVSGRCGRRFFVKRNHADRLAMFEAEAEGLSAILASATIRAPRPICQGVDGQGAYLVLEYLPLSGRGDEVACARQLAAMHRSTQGSFGWSRDNTIGSTPQINDPDPDWPRFWRDRRLGYQLALARQQGAPRGLLDKGERLMADLGGFFTTQQPPPSLLHGDLWGGNHGFCAGAPVIFDPAVYYGDREADLAMTELFGGFPAAFYAAYREAWPLDPGYASRKTLYNLYHVLNHFNMFGAGYADQAENMLDRLLAEIR